MSFTDDATTIDGGHIPNWEGHPTVDLSSPLLKGKQAARIGDGFGDNELHRVERSLDLVSLAQLSSDDEQQASGPIHHDERIDPPMFMQPVDAVRMPMNDFVGGGNDLNNGGIDVVGSQSRTILADSTRTRTGSDSQGHHPITFVREDGCPCSPPVCPKTHATSFTSSIFVEENVVTLKASFHCPLPPVEMCKFLSSDSALQSWLTSVRSDLEISELMTPYDPFSVVQNRMFHVSSLTSDLVLSHTVVFDPQCHGYVMLIRSIWETESAGIPVFSHLERGRILPSTFNIKPCSSGSNVSATIQFDCQTFGYQSFTATDRAVASTTFSFAMLLLSNAAEQSRHPSPVSNPPTSSPTFVGELQQQQQQQQEQQQEHAHPQEWMGPHSFELDSGAIVDHSTISHPSPQFAATRHPQTEVPTIGPVPPASTPALRNEWISLSGIKGGQKIVEGKNGGTSGSRRVDSSDKAQEILGGPDPVPIQPNPASNPTPQGENPRGQVLQYRSVKRGYLVWTDELHASFVRAVTALGERNAKPRLIRNMMNVPGLTAEHIKSHLQKYRRRLAMEKKGEVIGGRRRSQVASSDEATSNNGPNIKAAQSSSSEQCNSASTDPQSSQQSPSESRQETTSSSATEPLQNQSGITQSKMGDMRLGVYEQSFKTATATEISA